jgi:hypothetical protein
MINLIPETAKKRIVMEYWVRVTSVWFILWAFALLAGASLIYPSYTLITGQVDVFQSSAAEASRKVEDYQQTSVALVRSSQEARMVIDQNAIVPFSEYIALVDGLRGSNIELSQIRLSREEGQLTPIILTGIAVDRQSLASYRDILLAQPNVESVDLPISNLARDRDINFTITVVVNEANES